MSAVIRPRVVMSPAAAGAATYLETGVNRGASLALSRVPSTGTCVVLFPDTRRGGVLQGYDEWLVNEAVRPDPQSVPEAVLGRTRDLDPEVLLSSPGWRRLADLRRSARPGHNAEVREAFVDLVSADRARVG